LSTAKPLNGNQRAINYLDQSDWKRGDTPAQRRRKKHKYGHLAALERKLGRSDITK
jgi:hypothetical protein